MLKPTFCKKEDFKKLMDFIKKNWPRKNILTKNRKLFDWLYLNRQSKTYNFVISKSKNKILSCLGIIKNEVNLRTKKRGVIWLTMWLSVKDKKNTNSGIDLFYYLIKKYKKHIIGTVGLNESTILIYKILGFKTGYLDHYYISNPNIKKFNLVKVPINKNYNTQRRKSSFHIEVTNKINFYKKNINLKKYENFFFKNYTYFRSKYYENPFYKYKFYLINKKKRTLGFFVGRVCTYKGNKALRFVEYFGSKSALANIKYSLMFFLNKTNYEYVDFYNAGIENKFLKKSGFKLNKFKKNIVIPNYFEPFKRENIKLRYAIWPGKKILPIFKGDCDQERPNSFNP